MAKGDDDGKLLYEVQITHRMYVLAADADEAEQTAERHIADEPMEEMFARRVAPWWRLTKSILTSLPWNQEDEDRTVGQLMEDMRRSFEEQHKPPPPHEPPLPSGQLSLLPEVERSKQPTFCPLGDAPWVKKPGE